MNGQITIKLNSELFRKLLEDLRKFAGQGVAESDSDLVGKALFACYYFITQKQEKFDGKTDFEMLSELKNQDISEGLVKFLNDYYTFKKKGLEEYTKLNR